MKPTAVWGVVREIRTAASDLKPLLVSGTGGEAERLGAALGEGGEAGWVRILAGTRPAAADLKGVSLLVHVVEGGTAGAEDQEVFRLAARKKVPVLCVLAEGDPAAVPEVPYVLPTDVVDARAGEPVRAETVLEHAGEKLVDSYALAAKLPAIRPYVCRRIVEQFARQNGVLGATIFIPGADLPAMTLNQLRMVLRLAGAYGEELDRERAVEVLGVVGAGLGLRTVARQLAGFVPIAGWAVKGAIGYAGTKALGEAAIRYFEAGGVRRARESVRSRT